MTTNHQDDEVLTVIPQPAVLQLPHADPIQLSAGADVAAFLRGLGPDTAAALQELEQRGITIALDGRPIQEFMTAPADVDQGAAGDEAEQVPAFLADLEEYVGAAERLAALEGSLAPPWFGMTVPIRRRTSVDVGLAFALTGGRLDLTGDSEQLQEWIRDGAGPATRAAVERLHARGVELYAGGVPVLDLLPPADEQAPAVED